MSRRTTSFELSVISSRRRESSLVKMTSAPSLTSVGAARQPERPGARPSATDVRRGRDETPMDDDGPLM